MSSTWAKRAGARVWLMAAIVLLGAGLRLFRLTDQSLWYDEAFDVLWAQSLLGSLFGGAKADTMPPLHYALLHAWMWLGRDEFVIKLFPVFAGVLAVAVMYPVGCRLLDPGAGLGSAFLAAVSPFQVHYSREVRMYSQLLLFGLLSALFLVRALDDREIKSEAHGRGSWGNWVGWVAFTALTVYTHTLGFLVPLSMGGAALALKRRNRRFVRRLLLAGSIVLALAVPWVLWVLPQQADRVVSGFWVGRPSVLAPLVTLHMFVAGYSVSAGWMPVALFVTLFLICTAIYRAVRSPGRSGVLLLAWLLGPICCVWLFSLFVPLYLDRLFIASAPALYLLVAWCLSRMPRGLGYLFAAPLVGVMTLSLANYYTHSAYHKPPMRIAAAYVARAAWPGDAVLHTSDGSLLPFAFYQPQLTQFQVSGDPEHAPGTVRAQSLRLLGYTPVDAEAVLAAYPRVWLVVALDHSLEFQRDTLRRVASAHDVSLEQDVGGIEIYAVAGSGRAR